MRLAHTNDGAPLREVCVLCAVGGWAGELPDGEAIIAGVNPRSGKSRYLYFDVDGTFASDLFDQTVTVSVGYRHAGCSSFWPAYDNTDAGQGLLDGAFRRVADVCVEGIGQWKAAAFALRYCRFMDRCNGAAFQIAVLGGELELEVRKVAVPRSKKEGDGK